MSETLMTINHTRSTDLAGLLNQVSIKTKDLKIGDVVVDDFNVWQVATKELDESTGNYIILDADENGGQSGPDYEYNIIDRSSLRNPAEPRFY